MATTTKKNETPDAKAVTAAVQGVVNKKAEKVKIKLPKERKGEENFIIVSVNCKRYKIMKGVWVEVPRFVAEVVNNAEVAEIEAEKYIEKNLDNDK